MTPPSRKQLAPGGHGSEERKEGRKEGQKGKDSRPRDAEENSGSDAGEGGKMSS